VEANNVFYYLTYSGSVNRDVMMDEGLRRATELQIAHFGQIEWEEALLDLVHAIKLLEQTDKSLAARAKLVLCGLAA
jgi:hypothetical protein